MQEMKHCVFLATDVAARGVTLPNTHIVIDTNLERTIEGTVPVVKDALATLDMRLHKSVRAGKCAPGLAILLNLPAMLRTLGSQMRHSWKLCVVTNATTSAHFRCQ